ncbi:hypothetical protein [Oceanidesulfovibrio marinus]|uniref:Uncharacterized protein n=1 Tax=Oceanidesulfovibrio marinus TaxID=370038 RepID=A0A6P1ZDS1_9BACT|nr:hypothetical protein [Oceanidesulfovibrio marinus]TVM31167.1 hypothetical protein DQK91_18835 [Oceanidesulfovibrio marinus]
MNESSAKQNMSEGDSPFQAVLNDIAEQMAKAKAYGYTGTVVFTVPYFKGQMHAKKYKVETFTSDTPLK